MAFHSLRFRPSGAGSVTSVSSADANATVANPTTTPVITIVSSPKTLALISATTVVDVSAAAAPTTGQVLTATDSTHATWQTIVVGIGDMVLASVQTVTGAKTFNNAKLYLRNVADTFSGVFSNTITAAHTWTLPDKDGTVAMTSDITGTNSGTNTGDEVTAQTIGFTITKGTTPKTLTVPLDASVSGTNTGDQNLSGYALVGQTMYVGTTAVAINRASAALVLTGITSIDGNAATVTVPAALGASTATTQTASDNSTKVATTAFTQAAIANAIAGVDPAISVLVATTAAGDTSGLTYNNGATGIGAFFTGTNNTALTFDGVTLTSLNQRVLVKNDTQSPSGAFNGVYYLTQLQTAILPPILTRTLDYNQPSAINSTGVIPVLSGTVNALTSWLINSTVTTIGTDPITYTQFSYNPSRVIPVNLGGTGIANNAASTLTISGNYATTLTVTNTTGVTLPTTGTLATLAGSEAFTNKTYNGNTFTAGTGTLTIAASKVLTASNTLTLAGTDGTTMTFPAISANVCTVAVTTETTNTATVVAIGGTNHTHTITALASANTIGVPTIAAGSLTDANTLIFRFLDNATARALTWNAIFVARGVALPTTTVLSKYLYVGFKYNVAATKWDCIASSQEA